MKVILPMVGPVDVDMHPATVQRFVSHRELHVADPAVAHVLGITLLRSPAVARIARTGEPEERVV